MIQPSRLLLGAFVLASIVSFSYAKSSASSTGTEARLAASTSGQSVGNATQGSIIYAERCGLCHNAGGMGPNLKGENSRKNHAAVVAWIKNPQPPMPKLYPSQLGERDVNDVAAYVETLKGTAKGSPASANGFASSTKGKSVGGVAAAGPAAQGKTLYDTSCASCHGATGTEGGVGPSLKGEKSRKNHAAVVAWIKNPKAPMPKLYPSPLSEKQVNDIATYLETL
ncbi:MAG: c-type cytochrome [Candidatus Eremiobacteraeota bacterium]|nr:c-type cytochrome [Candidatus Eremiobacteraeota bacterium]